MVEDYFKSLNAINKSLLDAKTRRFFFVKDPIEININNAPVQKVELDFHPENEKGGRKFRTGEKFYITKEDFDKIKLREDDEIFRLMDCLNFRKDNGKFIFDSLEYEKYKQKGSFIIHWLPEEKVEVEVLMPDNKIVKGYGEKTMKEIKEGDIVQLERFGFCRLEKKNKKFLFWFGHK